MQEKYATWRIAPFTIPSALVLDPRVRWEPIDDTSVRLIVPFGEQEKSLRVEFNPETGLMTRMSGMRYRDQVDWKSAKPSIRRMSGATRGANSLTRVHGVDVADLQVEHPRNVAAPRAG